MNLLLDDSDCRESLFPFTHTRHVAHIRVGILTIRQKWEQLTSLPVNTDPASKNSETVVISACIIPTKKNFSHIINTAKQNLPVAEDEHVKMLRHPWQIFQLNDWAIRNDFDMITAGRISTAIPSNNQVISPENIFIEDGAQVNYCIINASTGPVYIGKDVQVMEGSLIRGPFSAGEGSVIKMGSRIYGATTVGPYCVAGGEIKNTVLFGYSNKAHDGYLGDSVIGEWCNLGAGSSNSNVKNTGGQVQYFLSENSPAISAGNKAGLLMGDYSRCAINTSFNTGTVVGVCCNIFGEMPAKYVPDFSWGINRYRFEKVITDIENWKRMKGKNISEDEITKLKELYFNNQ